MRQDWEPEDLIEVWKLLEEDQERLRNKSGANRLGFALLLKFVEVEARFPEDAGEIPAPAVSYVAQQVVPSRRGEIFNHRKRPIVATPRGQVLLDQLDRHRTQAEPRPAEGPERGRRPLCPQGF